MIDVVSLQNGEKVCRIPAEPTTAVKDLMDAIEATLNMKHEEQLIIAENTILAPTARVGTEIFSKAKPPTKSPYVELMHVDTASADYEARLAALQHVLHGKLLKDLDAKWTADPQIAVAAVGRKPTQLQFASSSITNDAVAMAAVAHRDTIALNYASRELWKDPLFMKGVCKADGLQLEHGAADMKSNREVVLIAVGQNGHALKFADQCMREDRDVVLAAIENKATSLCFAAPTLKNDKDLVMTAVKLDGMALVHASKALRQDEDVLEATKKRSGEKMTKHVQKIDVKIAGQLEKILESFRQCDTNGDGCIDKQELTFFLRALDPSRWTDEQIQVIMNDVDPNHDGSISFDEFAAWVFSTK